MSQVAVEEILKMIDGLSAIDREVLQQALSQRAEAEWKAEADAARGQAKTRGIDQAAIDEAVRKLRYGT